jgi:hypothetical protein
MRDARMLNVTNIQCAFLSSKAQHDSYRCVRRPIIQSGQKVSVHLMIKIHVATWLNLTALQLTARARGH